MISTCTCLLHYNTLYLIYSVDILHGNYSAISQACLAVCHCGMPPIFKSFAALVLWVGKVGNGFRSSGIFGLVLEIGGGFLLGHGEVTVQVTRGTGVLCLMVFRGMVVFLGPVTGDGTTVVCWLRGNCSKVWGRRDYRWLAEDVLASPFILPQNFLGETLMNTKEVG